MIQAQAARKPTTTLVISALCMALQMTGFVIILPLFARRFESFGSGVEALGVSAMAYALTSTLAAPFIGTLADRFGRRPVILFSLAGYVLAFTGFLLASHSWMFIVFRGLAGIFTAGLLPAMTSMVGDLAPGDRRALWIGILNGGASAGWISGPLLGGVLYDHFDYVVPFATSIAMAVFALLLALFYIPETRRFASHPWQMQMSWLKGFQELPARSTFYMLLLITFGVMFAWAFIEPQFMFYAYDDLGWSSTQLGMVMSAYGVAFMGGEFAFGRLSDRHGRKPVLVLGLGLFSSQFIGLVIFHQPVWIVVSFVLAGLGNALYDPALNALILDLVPPENTAGMIGLKSTAGSLGNMLGPALVVLLTPNYAPQMIFLIAALLVSLLTLLSWIALHPPQGFSNPQPISETAAER